MSTQTRGQRLRALLGELPFDDHTLELRIDEAMARHTTLRLGGPADLWARPSDEHALAVLLQRASACDIPISVVGGGSNLLVKDGGIRGLVVNLGRLNRVTCVDASNPTLIMVEAGASTGRVLKYAMDAALGGVEFLAGVPGSVGGGLMMNAGTYLGEFTNVVVDVRSITHTGTFVTRGHAECGFRYRASDLPADELVVSTRLRLSARARADIDADVIALRKRRDEREPHGVPNNGSTFKNPPGDHAGRLIESAGLKGTRIGGAVVSDVHANWLVVDKHVTPRCTAADMLALIAHVRNEVAMVHGVTLELEVKIVGDDA